MAIIFTDKNDVIFNTLKVVKVKPLSTEEVFSLFWKNKVNIIGELHFFATVIRNLGIKCDDAKHCRNVKHFPYKRIKHIYYDHGHERFYLVS
jgi:hypothetical protein